MTRASNGSLSDRELVYPSGNVLEGLRYDLCWHLILTDKFLGLKRTWLIEMFYQHLTGRKRHFYTNVCFANRVGVYIVFLFGFVVLSRRMGWFRRHEMLCVCFGLFGALLDVNIGIMTEICGHNFTSMYVVWSHYIFYIVHTTCLHILCVFRQPGYIPRWEDVCHVFCYHGRKSSSPISPHRAVTFHGESESPWSIPSV